MRGSSRSSEQPEHFSAFIRQSWSATRVPTSRAPFLCRFCQSNQLVDNFLAHLHPPDESNGRYPAVPIERSGGSSVALCVELVKVGVG